MDPLQEFGVRKFLIRSELRIRGYKRCVARGKPLLSEENRRIRKRWPRIRVAELRKTGRSFFGGMRAGWKLTCNKTQVQERVRALGFFLWGRSRAFALVRKIYAAI